MSSLSPLKDRILFDIRTIVTLTDGGEMRLADAIIEDVKTLWLELLEDNFYANNSHVGRKLAELRKKVEQL